LVNDASSRNGLSTRQIAKDITELVRRQCNISLDPHAGLMASGLTSKDLVALLLEIKARWDVEVSVDLLFSGGNLAALAQHVADEIRAAGKDSPMSRRIAVLPEGAETGEGAVQANARRALRRNIRMALGDSGE
jgi:Phosphopantetheine attachment site